MSSSSSNVLPPIIQAIGLACVPIADMSGQPRAISRKPIAAAIISLAMNGSGGGGISVTICNDARDSEFPLPVLLNEALAPGAPAILSKSDMITLAIDTASRRFFVEGHLANLATGGGIIEPGTLLGGQLSEAALCRRLSIPRTLLGDRDVALAWLRKVASAAEDFALSIAISRLMLWSHAESFHAAAPDPLFETLLPLRDWMLANEPTFPCINAALRSRPINRVSSFASEYAQYRARRDAGDQAARWVAFEDNLFHM